MKLITRTGQRTSIYVSQREWTQIGIKAGWLSKHAGQGSEGLYWPPPDSTEWDDIVDDIDNEGSDTSGLSNRDRRRERVNDRVERMRHKYDEAKAAPVGSQISCPYCGHQHTKSTYHKIFCCNRKTHGKANCKDRYWNMVREPWRYA